MQSVLRAVVHNGRQLVATSMLCTVIVYVYAVLGFWMFREMYVSESSDGEELMCSTVYKCFLFTLNQVRYREQCSRAPLLVFPPL